MTTRENSRFSVGDWVVHYFHGVGEIKAIVEKEIDGDQREFYKVSTKKMEYWLPVNEDHVDHIEPIRTKSDFQDALKILEKPPNPIGKYHKSRKKKIHNRWQQGNLNSRAQLLRDLYGRRKLEKLNFNEKQMAEKVRDFFIDEWVITDKDLSRKEARRQIHDALNKGIKKARRKNKKMDG